MGNYYSNYEFCDWLASTDSDLELTTIYNCDYSYHEPDCNFVSSDNELNVVKTVQSNYN